jgi:hypothetical protein
MIEIFHIFSIFTYLENGPNMQKSRKILSKILKKVDRRKQGKTPQNRSETLSSSFPASIVLLDVNVCDSFTYFHALFQRSGYERIWYNFGPKLGLMGLQNAPENDKMRKVWELSFLLKSRV